MNVLKTARKLRKELKKRGYLQTVEQCKYYVRDVLSNEYVYFISDDYVRRHEGIKTFDKSFKINIHVL